MLKGFYKKDIFGVSICRTNGYTTTNIIICETGDVLYTNMGSDHLYVMKETDKVLQSFC